MRNTLVYLRRTIPLWSLIAMVSLAAQPANALDPVPKSYKEKQRHEFRDVQLGLRHPAPHGRSKPVDSMTTAPIQETLKTPQDAHEKNSHR